MPIHIKVIYGDEKGEDVFAFQLPPTQKTFLQRHRAATTILCDLKRKIAEKKRISPIEQDLTFSNTSTSFDDMLSSSLYPTVFCSKRKRHPSDSIIVHSWNEAQHTISVDTKDSVIHLKFLLAQQLKTAPEYIHFVLNYTERIFNNSASLIKSGFLANNTQQTVVTYWLEMPCLDSAKPSEFIIRSQPKLATIPAYMSNVGKALRFYAKKFPQHAFLGTRKWSASSTRGEYEWLSYAELDHMVSCLATGFVRGLGLPLGTKMGICSSNRAEWVVADYAGHTQGFITVPLYDTLAKNAIEYIVNHASVAIIVCDKAILAEVVEAQKICPSLKHIVLMDLQAPERKWIDEHPKQSSGYTHTFSELVQFGATYPQGLLADKFAAPDDLCTICYTSGTTGDPKGVMLSHYALMVSVVTLSRKITDLEEGGAHISYLPLAHVFERLVEFICLLRGGKIGFWSGDILTLLDDIVTLRPTVFAGVPRVYQKFQDKIMMGVNEANFIKKALFNKAYSAKVEAIANGSTPSALWEKLVFDKIKQKFGGKIRACVSGSAPLSAATANFLKVCFADVVVEGYGLTETSASGTGSERMDNTYGQVGAVGEAVEMKLVDVEDMNYSVSDEPLPRGEVWFRGPALFSGYYRMKQKTEAVLFADGWFATGDVGQWRLDGKLQIIDRKKNIFKLAQGEYIRPEYIENVYKLSRFVGNIFVHGNSNETYLVGVVWPDMEVFASWCQQNGLEAIAEKPGEMIKNSKIKQLIRADMERIAAREQLVGFEKIKRIHLIAEDFSIDNGLLTSTMKLKRNVARERFKNEIEDMYKQAAKSKL